LVEAFATAAAAKPSLATLLRDVPDAESDGEESGDWEEWLPRLIFPSFELLLRSTFATLSVSSTSFAPRCFRLVLLLNPHIRGYIECVWSFGSLFRQLYHNSPSPVIECFLNVFSSFLVLFLIIEWVNIEKALFQCIISCNAF
jgi:hypothetical protein